MSTVISRLHWLVQRLLLEAGFRLVYPVLARLPARLGLACARLWGRCMARLDCEWRSVALRLHFIVRKTRLAHAEIDPTCTARQIERRVVGRFMCATQEELEGHWLARGIKPELPVRIEGLGSMQSAIANGCGVVLLTFHFDAALWGVAALGRAGLKICLMTSDVVEDPRVPRSVQRYFRDKYAGIASCLSGGAAVHKEGNLKDFYRRLQQGECIVLLADASFTHVQKGALIADFLGQRRVFAGGALRLARKTGATVAAFVCLREKSGYRLEISPPLGSDGDADFACRAALAFLESQVRARPESWWAADLLPDSHRL